MKKGLFIVLDGNDGSGKATQAALLNDYLTRNGIIGLKVDFPAYDRNLFGTLIGECLAGQHGDFVNLDPKIASTLYAADRFESSRAIREALNKGMIVIADRFASSNQIHQGGKIGDPKEREAFLTWLDRMEHDVFGIPRPDAIIYLKVPLETSLVLLQEKRALKNAHLQEGTRDTVEEDRNYLERSNETAQWLLETQANWHLVDCMEDGALRSREAIHDDVVAILERQWSL